MRKISLFSLVFIVGCSQLPFRTNRVPANLAHERKSLTIEVSKNRESVFANGVDSVVLEIEIKEEGKAIKVDPQEIKILGNREFEQTDFKLQNGKYKGEIRPKVGSDELKLIITYQEAYLSPEISLRTYLAPKKDKLESEPWQPSSSVSISNISYKHDENALPNQYHGFEFYNYGNNRIVNTGVSRHSNRQYLFEYPQHAAQNLSMMVVDAPNEFTSHGMYSHIMFFPRSFLPHIEMKEGHEVEVTIPTGEKVSFNKKSGEILGGVLQEGPVDTGPDRFKRKYAALHYSGKGILLRANARGQMPQQGQFENTKIDLQDGNSGSADVLIINGTTGERCRRPKSDFWSSADVQTILFKFPSDREFDAYLRSKCKFGIPEIEVVESAPRENPEGVAAGIWGRCLDGELGRADDGNFLLNLQKDFIQDEMRYCLNSRISELETSELKREVAYDLYLLYLNEREKEIKELSSVLKDEELSLEKFLENDLSWIKDSSLKSYGSECKVQARKFISQKMKFYDIRKDLNAQDVCERVKGRMVKEIDESQSKLAKKFVTDEKNFKKIQKISQFDEECKGIMGTLIDKEFAYSKIPGVYQRVFAGACGEVKESGEYKDFMASSEDAILEDVAALSFSLAEEIGRTKAQQCLEEFPMNNALNKVRFKEQRESCLTDAWTELEDKASREAFKKKGYSFNENVHKRVLEKLAPEARRLQLRIIQAFFK